MPNFVPISNLTSGLPHTFEDAPTIRHKAWAAGLDPAYWYPAEWDKNLAPGEVTEVKFWDTSVALFRGEDGTLGAVENRCAHRQVKLSRGEVKGCELMCSYHGWTYNCAGKLTEVGHEHFGGKMPAVTLRTYPVQVKYGLIWIFFGDPSLMEERPLPTIEVLEGDKPWVSVPLDFTIKCHPTAIINNVMDSTHVQSLHRKFTTRSMIYGNVASCETQGDTVRLKHNIKKLDEGGLLRWIVNPLKEPWQTAVYEYPYLVVSVGGVYKLWNFMRPIGPRETRLFLFPTAEGLRIPGTPWYTPAKVAKPFLGMAERFLARPLFVEDVWSSEAEQEGYDANHESRSIDPHPAIHPSYQLTVRKWEEHLARTRGVIISFRAGA